MQQVYLALGSNVGDSESYIRKATELLAAQLRELRTAPIYVSKAVGYTNQPDFYNTAVMGLTALSPVALLEFVKQTEQQIGRVHRFRWGPREIDIDIIFYGDTVHDTPDLTIPHPRFAERDFVLRPLVDIDPLLSDPVTGKLVSELLQQLPDSEQAILRKID